MLYFTRLLILFALIACTADSSKKVITNAAKNTPEKYLVQNAAYDSSIKTIHVFVALCDNKYQGIVPVPAAIGNGQDPDNNLYWGCGFGVRSYFKNSANWELINHYYVDTLIMERLVFKHKTKNAYLIADGYNGKYIKQCTINFLQSCAGQLADTLHINKKIIGIAGNARLIAYIGHDGLMDFKLPDTFTNTGNIKRDAIILACASRNYFWQLLWRTKASPLVWATNLMCPEAYTLYDAVETYLGNKSAEEVCNSAAAAYSKYQKCSLKAAKGLLISGWNNGN